MKFTMKNHHSGKYVLGHFVCIEVAVANPSHRDYLIQLFFMPLDLKQIDIWNWSYLPWPDIWVLHVVGWFPSTFQNTSDRMQGGPMKLNQPNWIDFDESTPLQMKHILI